MWPYSSKHKEDVNDVIMNKNNKTDPEEFQHVSTNGWGVTKMGATT